MFVGQLVETLPGKAHIVIEVPLAIVFRPELKSLQV